MIVSVQQKKIAVLVPLLVVAVIAATLGCGSDATECIAPDGSIIEIRPASQTVDTGGGGLGSDQFFDWTVVVTLSDGTPMNGACLNISGLWAVPSANTGYQFYNNPSWVIPNTAVDSGFSAKTNDHGQYTFSTLALGGTGTWKDTIFVRSGTNVGSADLELQ
jgi:hypothetical protein